MERNTDAMITQLLLLSAQEREQERQEKMLHAQEEEEELLATMQQQQRDLQRHDVLGMRKTCSTLNTHLFTCTLPIINIICRWNEATCGRRITSGGENAGV